VREVIQLINHCYRHFSATALRIFVIFYYLLVSAVGQLNSCSHSCWCCPCNPSTTHRRCRSGLCGRKTSLAASCKRTGPRPVRELEESRHDMNARYFCRRGVTLGGRCLLLLWVVTCHSLIVARRHRRLSRSSVATSTTAGMRPRPGQCQPATPAVIDADTAIRRYDLVVRPSARRSIDRAV